MWTKKFWADVAERVIKTFAQTWAALLVADGTDVISSAMGSQIQVSLIAALGALLMGIAGAGIGSQRTAAWLSTGIDTERGQTYYRVIWAIVGILLALFLLVLLIRALD